METDKDDKPKLSLEEEIMRCTVITKKGEAVCSRPTELLVNGFALCPTCYEQMSKGKIVFMEIPIILDPNTIGKSVFVKEI